MDPCIDKVLSQTYDKLDKILTGSSDDQASYIEHALSNTGDICASKPEASVHDRVLQCYLSHCRIILKAPEDISDDGLRDLAFPRDVERLCEQLCAFLTGIFNPGCSLRTRRNLLIIGESILYWVVRIYREEDTKEIDLSELWNSIILLIDKMAKQYSGSNESLTPRPTPTRSMSTSRMPSWDAHIRRMSTGRLSLNTETSTRPNYGSFDTILDAEADRAKRCSRSSSDDAVYVLKAAQETRHALSGPNST